MEAGLRAPAEDLDDKRRRIVDTAFYAGYGADMNFAALSLDGYGVTAWGEIHLELDQRAIGYRSTVLEENSFSYVEKKALASRILRKEHAPIEGGLATWDQRGILVACKLAPALNRRARTTEISSLLIQNTQEKKAADFLEVHIFGPYNHQAVTAVRSTKKRFTQPENNSFFDALSHVLAKRPDVTFHRP